MSVKRHLSYAQGYLGLGMVAAAAAELSRVPDSEHQRLDYIAIRIALLQEQKNWPALSAVAGALVRRQPGDAAAWVTWAYATRRADSLLAAERILLEAEQHHPAEPTIQFNLGCYACQRGDLETARQRVKRATQLDPHFAATAATDPDLAPLRAADATDCQPAP